MRELVESDIVAAYESVAPVSVALINRGKDCPTQIYAFQMDNTVAGRIDNGLTLLDPPQHAAAAMIQSMLGVGKDKELRKRLLDLGVRADLVVFVSEIWGALQRGDDDFEPPSKRSDRFESLCVLIYGRNRMYTVLNRISSNEKGKRVVNYKTLDISNLEDHAIDGAVFLAKDGEEGS